MERRVLGRTGLEVPVVGMGTWRTFDVRGAADESVRRDIVTAALAHGITLFDTSPMYGHAEGVLAAALGERRPDALVADKVWTSSGEEADEQIARALAWYGGRVEIYQVHNLVAWRTQLPKMERLREEGRVRVIGATHYQHTALAELLALLKSGRVDQVQVPYNAADHAVARDLLPAAEGLGIGVLVMPAAGDPPWFDDETRRYVASLARA